MLRHRGDDSLMAFLDEVIPIVMRQLVDGHDTGMLELSGNLRFAH